MLHEALTHELLQGRELAWQEELQEVRGRFEEERIRWEMERERAQMQAEVREWEKVWALSRPPPFSFDLPLPSPSPPSSCFSSPTPTALWLRSSVGQSLPPSLPPPSLPPCIFPSLNTAATKRHSNSIRR